MRKYCTLLFALLLLFSCQREEEHFPETGNLPATPEAAEQRGHLRIKLTSEAVLQVEAAAQTRASGDTETGISEWNALNRQLGTYRVTRTFPYSPKFEERHRKAGLHLWYDIYFNENVPTRSATDGLKDVPGIDIVEQIPVTRIDYRPVPGYLQLMNTLAGMAAKARTPRATAEELPFDDTRLAEQWHYNNTGRQVSPSIEEADINLFEAWQYETGSSEVIVAVIDEGVQYSHPDLAANIWINEAEKNGAAGADDDGNGYIDDIYGFNFVDNSGNITDMTHGTHVSGTIAAVNGNGIGISGIAGGNAETPGVRIMTCQIMDGTNKGGNNAASFVYAADNGASIAQCSWTIGFEPSASLEEAIDYFIEHAGYAVSGEQNGPMAGGIVIVAAANDNTDRRCYPASYEQVVAVSAFAPDLTRASYSNFGTWVDIAAPGGETALGAEFGILSTDKGSSYSWLQGTSMAAPHVSGVAALILSKFKGQGYTADDLKERLLASVHDIDPFNPDYAGLLGKGYVDAGLAVKPQGDPIPPAATELKIVASYNNSTIVEWSIAADEDDGHASRYTLKWESVNASAKGGEKTYPLNFAKAGDIVRDTLTNLKMGATYRYTLIGYDRWGNASEASVQEKLMERNNAPVLAADWEGNAFVDEGDVLELPYIVTDAEGHAVTCTLSPASEWMSVNRDGNRISVILAPDYGDYTRTAEEITLHVTDEYGASTSIVIPYKVKRKETAPRLLQQIPDRTITTLYREIRLPLADYFKEMHGEALIYEVENSQSNVCFAQSNGTHLILRGEHTGYTTILVRAKNRSGLSVSCRFRVDVKQ